MSARDAEREWLARWEAFEADLGVGEPAALRAFRREARDRFAAAGLPHVRMEEWRYTNPAPITDVDFASPAPPGRLPSRDALEDVSFPVFACSVFVFVNGRLAPELSSPAALSGGLSVESVAALRRRDPDRLLALLADAAPDKEHAFAALASAFLDDGAVVTLPRGRQLEQAIHLVFVATGDAPAASHPRVILRAEPGSRGLVIQDHVSLARDEAVPAFTNVVVQAVVEANAALDLVMLQREDAEARVVTNLSVRQQRDSRFTSHVATLGGRFVRNDVAVVLGDEGADCRLLGLFLGTGESLVDNHTLVDHAMPHGRSEEVYKGILAGRSRGVFRGRVIVRPGAQKTDARQSNPNLILGRGAEIDTKPQLEIHADDVKCSHGSAIGRIDPDALFYLRTRGLGEAAARALLTRGFAQEVLAELPHAALVEAVGSLLVERLHAAGVEA